MDGDIWKYLIYHQQGSYPDITYVIQHEDIESQKERFQSHGLWKEWHKKYSELYDEDDLRIIKNQPYRHFYEWLTAIHIYEKTGYLSLVEKYEFKAHEKKQRIFHECVPTELIELLNNKKGFGHIQCPDLFVYKPDLTDWFFCEVKGLNDRIRKEQRLFFQEIESITEKPIRNIQFKMILNK